MKKIHGDWELSLSGDKDFKLKIRDLGAKRELFERLLNILPEGLLVVDAEDQLVFINQGARVLLKSAEWLEKPPAIRMDRCPLAAMLHDTRHVDFLTYQRDIEIFEPSFQYLTVYCVPLTDWEDRKCRVFLVKDMTRQKLTEFENTSGPSFKDSLTFGAGIAHELGNPIASLGIHAQILDRLMSKDQRQPSEETQVLNSIKILNAELKRLDHTIKNFLDAVRPTHPQFRLVRIQDLIKDTIAMYQGLAREREITLHFQAVEMDPVLLDSGRIQQALSNILLNAIEASHDEGRVEMRVKSLKDTLEIQVQDYGKGIPTDEMVKIFDPFYTSKESGNGLGLLISYRVVRDHGGMISVKSKPNEGTTFMISLPLRRKAVNQLPARTTHARSE